MMGFFQKIRGFFNFLTTRSPTSEISELPPEEPKKNYIYVLKLENNKYYVGKSDQLLERLTNHKKGIASAWTSKYKFISIVEEIEQTGDFDEDNYVKKYMMEYGIDNVRGGSYSQLELSQQTKEFLEREFCTATDTCFKCHSGGHYINNCPNNVINLTTNLANHGKRWEVSEENFLIQAYQVGKSLKEISLSLGRTEYSIQCRLQRLGLL